MDDYTLSSLNRIQNQSSLTTINPLTSLGQGSLDFSSMLSSMLSGGGTGSGAGVSMDMMMVPVVLALLDKLLSNPTLNSTLNTAATVEPQYVGQTRSAGIRRYQDAVEVGGGRRETQVDMSQGVPSGLPVHGRISQGCHSGHVGIDYAIPTGTPIRSTMSGKVVYAGWNTQGYGNLVIVENGPYKTYYAHLSEIPVSIGDVVGKGSVIGLSGNTGNSTGPHLHYEIRLNDNRVDPTTYTK